MPLIFTDTLVAVDGSGSYTLEGLTNTWTPLTTITGPTTGNTVVSQSQNETSVDPSVFTPGQTYQFRWIDGNGMTSDIKTITVPYLNIDVLTAGRGTIDFVNTGGDSWAITFHNSPISYVAAAGVTVVSYDYLVDFWQAGYFTSYSGNQTADYTKNVSGLGAGVYQLQVIYNMSDGSQFGLASLILVDNAGTIVASIVCGGSTISVVSGQTITATIDLTMTNCSYPISWVNIPEGLTTGTTSPATMTLPYDTSILTFGVDIDSLFTNDFINDPFFLLNTISFI